MAEQVLDGAQIRPAREQMGGEGVPQSVRRRVFRQSVAPAEVAHRALGDAGVQPLAAHAQKQRGVVGCADRVMAEPAGQRVGDGGQHRNEALFSTLAVDPQARLRIPRSARAPTSRASASPIRRPAPYSRVNNAVSRAATAAVDSSPISFATASASCGASARGSGGLRLGVASRAICGLARP